MHVLVPQARGPVVHDLEVIGRGETRIAAAARDHHALLGAPVVAQQLVVAKRPIDERSAVNVAVSAARAHLPGLGTQGHRGPVHGCAADRLGGPGWQGRIVLGDRRRSGLGARLEPGELREGLAGHLREARERLARPGLQEHDLDAAPGELVRERPAAGA